MSVCHKIMSKSIFSSEPKSLDYTVRLPIFDKVGIVGIATSAPYRSQSAELFIFFDGGFFRCIISENVSFLIFLAK